MTDFSALSAGGPSAAGLSPRTAPAMLAEIQARKVYAQTAEQLVQAAIPPARQDSVAISPQAQALLTASSPPF